MKKLIFLYLGLVSCIFASSSINLASYKDIDFKQTKTIEQISNHFLGTKYKANSLIGSSNSKEKLVIDFSSFDCFTFIDTIESLKGSNSFDTFKSKLIDTRYKNGKISYKNRKHFFSDWVTYNKNIKDITCKIGKCSKITKYLNQKSKDKVYLKGITIIKRDIFYIQSKDIDISKLKTGDYIGIYTNLSGLDVTHTGIIIVKNGMVYLRHASSKKMKVIDSLLKKYISKQDGIIVYRNDN
ncbi:MAG: DUF1460 domain-containing protein [Campylobacterota bacterium]|nr:DUF1460 domain-containing protein [Campylobacterota bacterium]